MRKDDQQNQSPRGPLFALSPDCSHHGAARGFLTRIESSEAAARASVPSTNFGSGKMPISEGQTRSLATGPDRLPPISAGDHVGLRRAPCTCVSRLQNRKLAERSIIITLHHITFPGTAPRNQQAMRSRAAPRGPTGGCTSRPRASFSVIPIMRRFPILEESGAPADSTLLRI
jgi:hypothetical protein